MGTKKNVTQEDRILRFLKTHKRGMTKRQARDLLGVENVGGRIFDLRQAGHIIDTEWITVKDRYGNEVRIAQYHLIKEKE